MCRADDIKAASHLMRALPLTLAQRASLALAPVNLGNDEVKTYFLRYLTAYSSGGAVRLGVQLPLNDAAYLSRGGLLSLEAKHHALDVYLWLAARLGELHRFPDYSAALALKTAAGDMLEEALVRLSEETKGGWEAEQAAARRRRASGGGGSSRYRGGDVRRSSDATTSVAEPQRRGIDFGRGGGATIGAARSGASDSRRKLHDAGDGGQAEGRASRERFGVATLRTQRSMAAT